MQRSAGSDVEIASICRNPVVFRASGSVEPKLAVVLLDPGCRYKLHGLACPGANASHPAYPPLLHFAMCDGFPSLWFRVP